MVDSVQFTPKVYTDDHVGYGRIRYDYHHEAVRHDPCYPMRLEHLCRYVTEFTGRHNACDADNIDRMSVPVSEIIGKLRCQDLVA